MSYENRLSVISLYKIGFLCPNCGFYWVFRTVRGSIIFGNVLTVDFIGFLGFMVSTLKKGFPIPLPKKGNDRPSVGTGYPYPKNKKQVWLENSRAAVSVPNGTTRKNRKKQDCWFACSNRKIDGMPLGLSLKVPAMGLIAVQDTRSPPSLTKGTGLQTGKVNL